MSERFTEYKIDEKGPANILGHSKITKQRSHVPGYQTLVLFTLEVILIFKNI